jgi:hypothetical protein
MDSVVMELGENVASAPTAFKEILGQLEDNAEEMGADRYGV